MFKDIFLCETHYWCHAGNRHVSFFVFFIFYSIGFVKINYVSFVLKIVQFYTFFYIHKKKVLDSRKFPTFGFSWIYMFWDVLNTIWPFLENISLYVCTSSKFCWRCISRAYARKLMKLYIQLHPDINWCWLDFGAYHSRSTDVIPYFWFFF